MNKSVVIRKIINMPNDYSKRDDISYLQLLKDSGYFALHDKISVDDIKEELSNHRDLVQSWFQYSEDQRCDGWYLLQKNASTYVVGYYPGHHSISRFTDIIDACAQFVKNEIEDFRKM